MGVGLCEDGALKGRRYGGRYGKDDVRVRHSVADKEMATGGAEGG